MTSSFLRASHPTYISPLQRRFASDVVKNTEEEPKAPETTSAEEFDVADVQASATSEGREVGEQDSPLISGREGSSTVKSTISSAVEGASTKASEAAKGVAAAGRSALDRVSSMANGNPTDGPRTAEYPSARDMVYVGNLFFDVTEADLTREMRRMGTVKSVKIIYDGRGLSKG